MATPYIQRVGGYIKFHTSAGNLWNKGTKAKAVAAGMRGGGEKPKGKPHMFVLDGEGGSDYQQVLRHTASRQSVTSKGLFKKWE